MKDGLGGVRASAGDEVRVRVLGHQLGGPARGGSGDIRVLPGVGHVTTRNHQHVAVVHSAAAGPDRDRVRPLAYDDRRGLTGGDGAEGAGHDFELPDDAAWRPRSGRTFGVR